MEPAQAMQGVTTSEEPPPRPSRRVRFSLPDGSVVCPRRAELASSDTSILATGGDTTQKHYAPEDSSEPASPKRCRGDSPPKHCKGFHQSHSAVLLGTSGTAEDAWFPEDELHLSRLCIDASAENAEASHAGSEPGHVPP
ncbi:uncharacterized protein LOC142803278 [Rhipicephalus microplus]|uniref:uncharacterized protein LOC142803278 n=1 Tax=Rhipicephalus microplus TaxID=6941 RepID=UPI003F6A5955